jgi:ABC-type Fe3+/spermidine/putrescine transport system ATPase subunit
LSPADELLRLNRVRKSYPTRRGEFGGALAVDDVSLALGAGEILTLLGPSGCGKTTTLRIAVGLERTDAGEVSFAGKLVDAPDRRVFVPPERRNMGMVFQSYAIWPHMTVFENVAYPLRARRRPPAEIREKVLKVLGLVGLGEMSARSGTRLSGGQQQRVAIARALAFGCDLLLMDEPFSNLDSQLRLQMRSEVKLLQRTLGIAVLFVTHDQSEALALSDRIALMRAGRIEQVGTPLDLYYRPETVAVRDFLGAQVLLTGRIKTRTFEKVHVDLDEGIAVVSGGGDHAPEVAAGAGCTVAIRPERIIVDSKASRGGVADPNTNVLVGEVLTLLFMGSQFEARVRLSSGKLITVMLPSTDEWREGDAVRLTFPEAAIQVWPNAGNPS